MWTPPCRIAEPTVRRIAHLARIKVSEHDVPHLHTELNAILAFVEELASVDVEGVEPMKGKGCDRCNQTGRPGLILAAHSAWSANRLPMPAMAPWSSNRALTGAVPRAMIARNWAGVT